MSRVYDYSSLRKALYYDSVTTRTDPTLISFLLENYTLVNKVETDLGVTLGNIYKGPLKFKGRNPKIIEEVTHLFDPSTSTRSNSVRYIRYVSKYDPNARGYKSTLAPVEVFPIV